jgi:tetratricopeptide (TPR) repeat protein
VRLGHEGSPFGSVAVAPFVLLAVVPVTMLVADARLRRWLQAGLAVLGVPLTLLSGSRSAWLAMAVAAAILVLPQLRRVRLRRLRTWRGRAAAAAVAVLAIGGVAFIAPRLTDVSSLIYRGYLWRDTLAAWAPHALFGIGPGTMPWARQAAAPALTFPVRQPHSHDVLLGILGDAGIMGMAAAIVLFGCFIAFAGPWRTRTAIGRVAFAILVGFGVGSLFEDLTFLPNFNLLLMLLVAITLADAGAVDWVTIPIRRRLVVPATAAVSALLLVALIADGAAIDYRVGVDAAAAGDWRVAQRWLQDAVDLDPWHPTGPKALAVAADWNGDLETARDAAARAVELNAGDGASWTNLAIVCLELEDASCAEDAAGHAVDEASLPGRELINAALVYEKLGLHAQADRAYRLSLLTNYWTGLTTSWPRHLTLESSATREVSDLASELNTLIAHRVLSDQIVATSYQDPIVASLAYAMLGDRTAAEAALRRAQKAGRASPLTWEITALLEKHWGQDPTRALRLGEVTRGAPLAEGASQVAFAIFDIASFRGYPADGLVLPAVRLLPEQPWPWVLEPLLAPAG